MHRSFPGLFLLPQFLVAVPTASIAINSFGLALFLSLPGIVDHSKEVPSGVIKGNWAFWWSNQKMETHVQRKPAAKEAAGNNKINNVREILCRKCFPNNVFRTVFELVTPKKERHSRHWYFSKNVCRYYFVAFMFCYPKKKWLCQRLFMRGFRFRPKKRLQKPTRDILRPTPKHPAARGKKRLVPRIEVAWLPHQWSI